MTTHPRTAVLAALASVLSVIVLSARAQDATPNVVVTRSGPVRGIADSGLTVFKGIPFARAPVGDLRWRPPQAPEPWKDARDARDFAPACSQPARNPNRRDGLGAAPLRTSEDCLFLNVWTPNLKGSAPVMVWIHGGAHRFGATSQPFYDGAQLARQGVVLVSISYRLGFFGYFGHPALTAATDRAEAVGNYGLMDQLAGLQWVQQNIAAFGGDPR